MRAKSVTESQATLAEGEVNLLGLKAVGKVTNQEVIKVFEKINSNRKVLEILVKRQLYSFTASLLLSFTGNYFSCWKDMLHKPTQNCVLTFFLNVKLSESYSNINTLILMGVH